MDYTLIGSQTSPFVRRIRMLLDAIPFEFVELNIFETDDALTLNRINPANQVPVLKHGEVSVIDSRQIFIYLNKLHRFQELDWQDENRLTILEGAMNSAVTLLLMKRSGMKIDEPYMFINRQKERIESVLDSFKPYLETPGLNEWNFLTMTLYSFLDWGVYRGILNIDNRPECQRFLEAYKDKEIVIKTAIPKV